MCKIKNLIYMFYIIYYYILINNDKSTMDISFKYLPLGPGIFYRNKVHNLKMYKEYIAQNINNFTKFNRLKTDLKYILRWSKAFSHYSSTVFTTGQQPFIKKNCSNINCYVTDNKALLGDTRHFDAILFDVENFWDLHPELRSPHQKYIFVASESADNYPICAKQYDDYYNWTWTYKINSNIRWSFVTILNKYGEVVGPKKDMEWIEEIDFLSDKVKKKLSRKKIAAAWFVSHCNSKSGRDNVTRNLQKALKAYNLTVDVYGWCGNLTCSRDRLDECLKLIQTDYYFYLSFENSLSEDYVTEKILYPLQYYAVPVVYGGADYSRFLPPRSYLDAGLLNATVLAAKMFDAIRNPSIYHRYFSWHNYYKFVERPAVPDICTLCSMMNDEKMMRPSNYHNFRKWWIPDFEHKCSLSMQ